MENSTELSKKNWALSIYSKLEDYLLGYLLLILAILAVVQFSTRYLFRFAFFWLDEVSRYSLILATFLGASLGVKHGTHFSMEAFVKSLPEKGRLLLNAIVSLGCSFLFVLVIYYGFKHVLRLQKFGATTPALGIPIYYAYLSIPLFSIAISIRYLLSFVSNLKAFLDRLGSERRNR
jgi:C4-dicarboxylate transporter DctQ subunit